MPSNWSGSILPPPCVSRSNPEPATVNSQIPISNSQLPNPNSQIPTPNSLVSQHRCVLGGGSWELAVGGCLDPHNSRGLDRFHLPNFLQHARRQRLRLVNVDDANGAMALASEREVRDVDAVTAQDGAHLADHA